MVWLYHYLCKHLCAAHSAHQQLEPTRCIHLRKNHRDKYNAMRSSYYGPHSAKCNDERVLVFWEPILWHSTVCPTAIFVFNLLFVKYD